MSILNLQVQFGQINGSFRNFSCFIDIIVLLLGFTVLLLDILLIKKFSASTKFNNLFTLALYVFLP